jgi:hypothetical protein
MAKNEVKNNTNEMETELRQMKALMKSPVFKKAMKDAEAYFDGLRSELSVERNKLKLIQDSIGEVMLGKPAYRNLNTVKVIEGHLLQVHTNEFSIVTSVKPVKNFEELTLTERTTLYEENKKLYKALQMGLYQPPVVTDKVLDLLILENEVQYEKFDILASKPSKPSLTGLDSVASSDAVRQYTEGMANYEASLKAYEDTIADYTNGKMNSDKYDTEEKIKSLEVELK